MEINRILVAGTIYNEMEKRIDSEQLEKSFRFMDSKAVTEEDLEWADAFISFEPPENFDFYNLKWVHSLGAGVDRYLFNRKWKEDVLLTRTICSFGERISQYCLSYVLKDLQHHDTFEQVTRQKEWNPIAPGLLSEQKVLVYGTGEIGQEVGRAFSTLGAKVSGVSLSGHPKPHFEEVYKVTNEKNQLHNFDIIINTLPLTENTYQLFNHDFFTKIKDTIFINVGRGRSVIQEALVGAIQNKQVRLAVLDVFAEEPLPEDSPLWQMQNVIITPHISAVTTVDEGLECFLETLHNIDQGKPLHNQVDTRKGY
ncbi:D-2-hydroxyacid dehydrogenase [Salinibacillus xinjiangensis]|uniref:D-2-hydroxyacid dehydrogenase n=1 Tax=Salinibacillus xinjiangensis TaxID=1229268 RepID=A0A6G1XA99_9BACI|nr:D-2-hydroxyacid dehydrogenase [Salinibacillus xinjiangensis]MRG87826.1 D-2-hydroxyacid dehydrogenase [Salinibacillus xinjiangensis]